MAGTPANTPNILILDSDVAQLAQYKPLRAPKLKPIRHSQLGVNHRIEKEHYDNSSPEIGHLKPLLSTELSAVTAVKIVNSRNQRPLNSPSLTTPNDQADQEVKEHSVDYPNSSRHFDELDNLNKDRLPPPAYLSEVVPKMQNLVWESGGFPARLKPVRVKRDINDTALSLPDGNGKTLEPKIFDFSPVSATSLTSEYDDDFDDLEQEKKASYYQEDNNNNYPGINSPPAKNNKFSSLLDHNESLFVSNYDSVNNTLKFFKQENTNATAGKTVNIKFPPVSAVPVIQPLGHQLFHAPAPDYVPRLPALHKVHSVLPSIPRNDRHKQGQSHSSKSLSTADKQPDPFIITSKDKFKQHHQLLSLSGTPAEMVTSIKKELQREKNF